MKQPFYILKITLIFLLVSTNCYSQTEELKYCGQLEAINTHYLKHPELKQLDLLTKQQIQSKNPTVLNSSSGPYIIPVVFHIMHQFGTENISDAQVRDAVRILNEDFQLKNADTTSIVPSFQSIKANVKFEFRLAKKDPNGNCTNGILHVESATTETGDDDVKFDQWNPAKYLNIWVVKNISFGAAGYAYYPYSADNFPAIDGIVIESTYVGSIGTGTYSRSRALTHEVGHYMDLAHVWGSTNKPGVACGDDGVLDTPETMGWESCNLNGSICNAGIIENVQNYMEYAYCSRMFSLGQAQRMTNAITSSIANRNNLWSTSNLIATGTDDANYTNTLVCAPISEFKSNYVTLCEGNSISFTDLSYNGTPTFWAWTFAGGNPSSSSLQNPIVSYTVPGIYPVKLKVANSQGADSTTKFSYLRVESAISMTNNLIEGFETITLPNTNWQVNDGGDGISWQTGNVGALSSKSSKISNYNVSTVTIDELISPSINLLNAPSNILTFDVAYAQKNTNSTDKLRVLVSKNCGQTWFQIYSKQGSALATSTNYITGNFTPASSQWRKESVTIAGVFTSSHALFKFEFTSGKGNNVYLDNINISAPLFVAELNQNDFIGINVFPNPIENGSADLKLYSKTNNLLQIELKDILGKTLRSFNNVSVLEGENIFKIDAVDLSKGIYFITISSSKDGFNSLVKKVIIQ